MKTKDQRFHQSNTQIKVTIAVHVTREQQGTPTIKDCRHAVLQLNNKDQGYVVYDRLLCRIVNGVFYGDTALEDALGVAQYYNENENAPQDMAPNGAALGLKYPSRVMP